MNKSSQLLYTCVKSRLVRYTKEIESYQISTIGLFRHNIKTNPKSDSFKGL